MSSTAVSRWPANASTCSSIGRWLLEIKATEQLPRFAHRQLLNYLTVTKLELGLILHFGPEAKFHRMVSTKTWLGPIRDD